MRCLRLHRLYRPKSSQCTVIFLICCCASCAVVKWIIEQDGNTEEFRSVTTSRFRSPCWYERLPANRSRQRRYHTNWFYTQGSNGPYFANKLRYQAMFERILRRTAGATAANEEETQLRCLPLVFIVGVAKCGTTSLYDQLDAHPDITSNKIKENDWIRSTNYTRNVSLSNYIDLWDICALEIENHPQRMILDAPTHIIMDHDAPKRIHSLVPNAKILISLRNPTDRTLSAYRFMNNMISHNIKKKYFKFDPHIFHAEMKARISAVISERGKLIAEIVGASVDYNMTNLPASPSVTAVARGRGNKRFIPNPLCGCYGLHLPHWMRQFGNDRKHKQIHVTWLENRHEDPTGEMSKIFNFLGVTEPNLTTQQKIARIGLSKVREKRNAEMLPETRTMLDDFFAWCNKGMV